jgi:hypothetical protein
VNGGFGLNGVEGGGVVGMRVGAGGIFMTQGLQGHDKRGNTEIGFEDCIKQE